jgi:hypothetical protein
MLPYATAAQTLGRLSSLALQNVKRNENKYRSCVSYADRDHCLLASATQFAPPEQNNRAP